MTNQVSCNKMDESLPDLSLTSASTNQPQPLTLESLDESIEELNKHNISMYKAMALSSLDIFPDAKLPEGYWCIHCSPDVYIKIQIEIDKINNI